jgi:hypothetical protein
VPYNTSARRAVLYRAIYPRRTELPALKIKTELPAQNRVTCSKPSHLPKTEVLQPNLSISRVGVLERQTGQWNYRSNETQNARAFKQV